MMRYRDAHPEATIEETSKALGYTEEEMAAMIRNFSMIQVSTQKRAYN